MRFFVDVAESFRIAVGAIWTNKARGALTTLGIIIGIVAVITTMTAFNGMQNAFRQGFASVGSDVIYVSRMPWVIINDFFLYRNRPRLELAEAGQLERNLQGKAIVNPSMSGNRDVKYKSQRVDDIRIIGTTEKQTVMSSSVPEVGRFMMAFDIAYKKNVAVIGQEIDAALFDFENSINKEIWIGRSKFRVIGVMEKARRIDIRWPKLRSADIHSYIFVREGLRRRPRYGCRYRSQSTIAGSDGRPRVRGDRRNA